MNTANVIATIHEFRTIIGFFAFILITGVIGAGFKFFSGSNEDVSQQPKEQGHIDFSEDPLDFK